MTVLQTIALIFTIVGAINWGLIGLFNFDLVACIFGGKNSLLTKLIYILVGIAGIICISVLL